MSEKPETAETLEDPDILEEARSPLSGMGSAMSAGASLLETAQSMMAQKARRGVKVELPAYLSAQATWVVAQIKHNAAQWCEVFLAELREHLLHLHRRFFMKLAYANVAKAGRQQSAVDAGDLQALSM